MRTAPHCGPHGLRQSDKKDAGDDDGGGANSGVRVGRGADAPHGKGQAPVGVQSSCAKDELVVGAEERLTPEGSAPGSRLLCSSDALLIFTRGLCSSSTSPRSRKPYERLSWTSRLLLSDAHNHAVYRHILPVRPFTQVVTTPLNIKHSTFNSLSAFLRTAKKGGLLKLKVARPDVVVALYPTRADVVAHRHHSTVREEDKRRSVKRSILAAAANAEKNASGKCVDIFLYFSYFFVLCC